MTATAEEKTFLESHRLVIVGISRKAGAAAHVARVLRDGRRRVLDPDDGVVVHGEGHPQERGHPPACSGRRPCSYTVYGKASIEEHGRGAGDAEDRRAMTSNSILTRRCLPSAAGAGRKGVKLRATDRFHVDGAAGPAEDVAPTRFRYRRCGRSRGRRRFDCFACLIVFRKTANNNESTILCLSRPVPDACKGTMTVATRRGYTSAWGLTGRVAQGGGGWRLSADERRRSRRAARPPLPAARGRS